jgi:aryl sulfotransferase
LTAVRYQSFLTDSARWEGFQFRPGDIIISTPAKCGTTWTQMICALLIFQAPELPRSLDLLSPWLEMRLRRRRDVFDLYEAQTHRRFIKSHTPLDGLPADERVTYICVGRDPRDVALSWNAHMNNLDFDAMFMALGTAIEPDDYFEAPRVPPTFTDERDAIRYWVDDPTPPEESAMSLAGLVHHLAGFWAVRDRDDVVLLHYDDLQTDLEGEMRRLADRLGIAVLEERWPALVKAASFDEMRRRADRSAPDTANRIWKSTADFFHRGTSGQWEDLFDADLAAHYEARVRELAAPDLVAWLHPRGDGGVPPTEAA